MTKIVTAILLSLLLLTSCDLDNVRSMETSYWYKGQTINELEYKGHIYVVLGNIGIAHAGHCKCNNN